MPTNLFENIPLEMREYKSWCVWKYVDKGKPKLDKVPYKADGYLLDPTDSNDWMTWDQALSCAPIYDGIGFVFSDNCPLAFIDLDDTSDPEILELQEKIFNEFDSYSEYSPSGKGLHIIIKGSIPHGRNYGKIELYSNGRFGTVTGNVFRNKPIADYTDLFSQLYHQMNKKFGRTDEKSTLLNIPDGVEINTDAEILELAYKYNSEKFPSLALGEWRENYPSQSEADLAYMNIVGSYTKSKAQTVRIYCNSKLAETDKKRRTPYYLNKTVNLAFDQKLPDIVLTGYDEIKASVAQRIEPAPHKSKDVGSSPIASTIIFPPGLVGEIAQFIFDAAPRPVKEMAMAGAIGLMAGICGKAYNVSRTGLNQYILVLAPTATGKEQMASGISKLIAAARLQVPVAGEFIGPSSIASNAGLHKWLSKNSQCFVSILGEFGLKLQAMSDTNANANQILLKDALLDLFNKSGKTDVYGSSAYSDQEKNSLALIGPAFSILGESTPESFYPVLTEQMISQGLLPRFSIIEYDGIRVPSNKNPIDPPDDLVNKICILMSHVKTAMATHKVVDILQNIEAKKLSDEIDVYSDNQVNQVIKSGHKNVVSDLWGRSHLKVLKLAALIAVGNNPFNPIITKDDVEWSWNIVQNDIKLLSHKFESGMVGKNSEELKQAEEMTRIIKEYLEKDFEYVAKYLAKENLHKNKIICNNYLNNRLGKLAIFRNDRLGTLGALKRCIQSFVDNGKLIAMGGPNFIQKYNTTSKCWLIN